MRLFPLFLSTVLVLQKLFAIEEWTLEQKVGQLLMVHFNGNEINEDARALIEQVHVGGFIYYQWANELSSPPQVQQLSSQLQKAAKATGHLPLLLAIDQEGGVVYRLTKGFTVFPGNQALAQAKQPELAQACAKATGIELKAVGINMNLAPVVDVNYNPRNPVIGIRAFSHRPEEVVQLARYMLMGFQDASIIPVLKHFPGHGDALVDSHDSLPTIQKTVSQLEEVDLFPFRKLASQVDVMMTAHLLVPALDAARCVTLSKTIIQQLIREQMQFNRVVMSDSLIMQALIEQCGDLEEAAIQCLEAGHDLILLGGKRLNHKQHGGEISVEQVKKIHQALVNAVLQGRLSREQIDISFERIQNLKHRYALVSQVAESQDSLEQVGTLAHQALANQIATQALKVFSSKPLPCLKGKRILGIAPVSLKTELDQINCPFQLVYFDPLNLTKQGWKSLLEEFSEDEYLFFSYNSWKYPILIELVKDLRKLGKSVIVIVVRDPLDVELFKEIETVLCTYSPIAASLQAALNCLKGSSP